jgi:hypothetical protein
MAGTEIALDVVDNPPLFQDLVRHVSNGRRSGELMFFEALIRAHTLNGVAGESSIVASRVVGEQ